MAYIDLWLDFRELGCESVTALYWQTGCANAEVKARVKEKI